MYEDEEKDSGRPGLPIDTGRIWQSLQSGWKLIPLVTLAAAALGVTAALQIKHSYKSETVLIWEPVNRSGRPDRELSTQAGILKLPGIIEETRRRLSLPGTANKLANRIDVWFDRNSSLVTVEAGDATAEGAARLADTLVSVFLDHQRTLEQTRASELVTILERDLRAAQGAVRSATTKYEAFRAKHDVIDPIAEAAQAREMVTSLKDRQANATAEATALEAQVNQLGAMVRKQPKTRVSSASSSNAAAQQLAQTRAQLTAAKARLAPTHPSVLSLEAQIRALEQQAEAGTTVVQNTVLTPDPEFDSMRAILSSARAEQVALAERGKTYKELLVSAEERLARLVSLETQAKELVAQVEHGKQRVDELGAQLVRAREAVREPPVEFRVLTPAVVPEYPEKSKRRAVIAASFLLGLLGSIAFLVLRPLRNGAVHTAREAAFWANLPVLASTAWPGHSHLFFPFVDELSDHALRTKGTTLILGLGPHEMRRAQELARALNPLQASRAMGGSDGGSAPSVQGFVADPSAEQLEDDEPAATAAASTRQPVTALALRTTVAPAFFAWQGAHEGPALRRAVRIADRVVVLVSSGTATVPQLASLKTRLGRQQGIGLVLLDLSQELLALPDRAGDVEAFWQAVWVDAEAA